MGDTTKDQTKARPAAWRRFVRWHDGHMQKHPFRTTLATLGGIFAIHSAVGIPTTHLLPTAEEHFAEKGLDPDIVSQITDDTTVRIQERSFPYALRMAIQYPQAYLRTHWAAAWPGWMGEYKLAGQCPIIMPGKQATAEGFISLATQIPEEMIENTSLNNEEMFWAIVFHEIRHCDADNDTAPPYKRILRLGAMFGFHDASRSLMEQDSDIHGFLKAAEVFDNPEINQTLLYMRAMQPLKHITHDTSLYLDAHLNGTEIPKEHEAIKSAAQEAYDLMQQYLDSSTDEEDFVQQTKAFRKVIENHGDTMSPLAKRRAELYVEAAEYFAPSAVMEKTKLAHKLDKQKVPRPT